MLAKGNITTKTGLRLNFVLKGIFFSIDFYFYIPFSHPSWGISMNKMCQGLFL